MLTVSFRSGCFFREHTMGNRNGIVSIAVAGLLCAMAMAVEAAAQEKSRYPDWSGQWSRVPDGGVPRYDPTKSIRKQEAPLKPEYQARFEASMRDQDLGGVGLDMAYSCRPPGMPRMMSGVALMEFLISPGVTHILFDRNDYAPRRIYTDGREWPKIGIDDTTFPQSANGSIRTATAAMTNCWSKPGMCAIRAPGTKAACRWRMTTRASSRNASSWTRAIRQFCITR